MEQKLIAMTLKTFSKLIIITLIINIHRLPIHKAAKYGIYDFVELLAEYGADINAVDKKKKMPLNYVENRVEEPEFEKICTFLRSNGAENDWMKDIKKDDEFNDLE